MIDEYAIDTNFKDVMSMIALGNIKKPFQLKDGYLLYDNRLCVVTHNMHKKFMYKSHAPPYVGHRGIQAMLKGTKDVLLLAQYEERHKGLCFFLYGMPKGKVK